MKLDCRDVGRNASAYLDGDLRGWARMAMRLHLFMCVHCRRHLHQIRLAKGAIRLRFTDASTRPDDTDDLVRRLLDEHNRR
jgi:predicted anti-sigma-YlaC factor YlaD